MQRTAVPLAGSAASTRRELIELFAEARARTILLVSPLSHEQLQHRPDPAVQSVLAALERILRFEQSVLLGESVDLPIDSYDSWFDQMMDVRQRVLEQIESSDSVSDSSPAHNRYRLVMEHEYRRDESILETVQTHEQPYHAPHYRTLPRGRNLADPGAMVRFAGGSVEIGCREDEVGWPDERPAHLIELQPFWIDLMPVTNADYMTFMAAHGYQRTELWSEEGWAWLVRSGVTMPANWFNADGLWWSRWLGQETPLDPACPVSQVSQFEAEAFATFVGKRLPTELEWEVAAVWDPESRDRRAFPWGNMPPSLHVANLDQLGFGLASVGAFPGNVSPLGCYGMIGDAWEWTSSPYSPYPGWRPEPSIDLLNQRFDPEQRVLRGCSWASRIGATRVTTRRAEPPAARHLFAGFRCARS